MCLVSYACSEPLSRKPIVTRFPLDETIPKIAFERCNNSANAVTITLNGRQWCWCDVCGARIPHWNSSLPVSLFIYALRARARARSLIFRSRLNSFIRLNSTISLVWTINRRWSTNCKRSASEIIKNWEKVLEILNWKYCVFGELEGI